MDQEWRATAVAIINPSVLSDEMFERLDKLIQDIINDDEDNRLTMVWDFKAPTIEKAFEAAGKKASEIVSVHLGGYGTLRQLHVVHAEDVEIDRKALITLLGLTEV